MARSIAQRPALEVARLAAPVADRDVLLALVAAVDPALQGHDPKVGLGARAASATTGAAAAARVPAVDLDVHLVGESRVGVLFGWPRGAPARRRRACAPWPRRRCACRSGRSTRRERRPLRLSGPRRPGAPAR